MDLHMHTPASSDFQEPEVSFLDILHRCEARGLDIAAFTDHNTVAGYRRVQEEIQQLELLESLARINEEERRLASISAFHPILVLRHQLPPHSVPHSGTSPTKPVREIEHLLLSLRVPAE
jgi:hypothetical protein